jgi:hypothetical protein
VGILACPKDPYPTKVLAAEFVSDQGDGLPTSKSLMDVRRSVAHIAGYQATSKSNEKEKTLACCSGGVFAVCWHLQSLAVPSSFVT